MHYSASLSVACWMAVSFWYVLIDAIDCKTLNVYSFFFPAVDIALSLCDPRVAFHLHEVHIWTWYWPYGHRVVLAESSAFFDIWGTLGSASFLAQSNCERALVPRYCRCVLSWPTSVVAKSFNFGRRYSFLASDTSALFTSSECSLACHQILNSLYFLGNRSGILTRALYRPHHQPWFYEPSLCALFVWV